MPQSEAEGREYDAVQRAKLQDLLARMRRRGIHLGGAPAGGAQAATAAAAVAPIAARAAQGSAAMPKDPKVPIVPKAPKAPNARAVPGPSAKAEAGAEAPLAPGPINEYTAKRWVLDAFAAGIPKAQVKKWLEELNRNWFVKDDDTFAVEFAMLRRNWERCQKKRERACRKRVWNKKLLEGSDEEEACEGGPVLAGSASSSSSSSPLWPLPPSFPAAGTAAGGSAVGGSLASLSVAPSAEAPRASASTAAPRMPRIAAAPPAAPQAGVWAKKPAPRQHDDRGETAGAGAKRGCPGAFGYGAIPKRKWAALTSEAMRAAHEDVHTAVCSSYEQALAVRLAIAMGSDAPAAFDELHPSAAGPAGPAAGRGTKRLLLLIHPDKSSHPCSTEAFQQLAPSLRPQNRCSGSEAERRKTEGRSGAATAAPAASCSTGRGL